MTERSEDAAETSPALGTVAASAFGWSFFNTAFSRLGTLAIGIALARLLGPEEFGTFAVATVALVAVLSFNELGVSLAIVRWKTDPLEIAPTVTTISVVMSAVLFVGMYVSAPAVSTALGDASAAGVVRLMAVAVVISGLVATPAALMQRHFQQRRRMLIDQINTWLGAGISLALAVAGMGAWSLAIGRVISSTVAAVLFMTWSSYSFRFGFDAALTRRLLGFGLPLAGASIIVFVVGYAEQMVTGGILGATALGYYVLAFNLASWPVNMFSQPLRNVAPAAFARLQGDEERMHRTFEGVLRSLCIVTMPVCIVLAAAAPDVVRFVYGADWAPAANVLRVLALVAVARILFELSYDYLVVLKRSGALFAVQVVWLVLLVPALLWAAREGGLVWVATAQLLLVALVIAPLYLTLLRTVGVKAGTIARACSLAVLASLVPAAAVVSVDRVVTSSFLVCLAAGVGCLLTMAALAAPHRELIRSYARGRRARSLGGPAALPAED